MKKLFVFVLLIVSVQIFSQEKSSANQENAIADSSIYEDIPDKAEYPGGINAFRNNFSKTFKAGKVSGRGKIKSEIRFVVDQQGMITDIITIGDNKSMNKEMERTIKAMSKTKWVPAKIDGEPVKFRFKLPITINIEN
ncbi:energy transducer TonB [Chryseobacterium chendengshani]|uniref:energy transducer TonB n=2 Tax=unclassified Chryseobacterium TaxID=2593645 RepID=UPI001C68B359|nr:energy transducer TonB [Chryseobacterium sp. LJ668]MBW8522034.1 energy transducer TonB [Chryseobacterium sp. LJ668]QYK17686.1 energy transducer TonB [Chryseobacterium sp. LJ668]